MPLPKPNHKCACCGKEYYACNYCDKTGYKWLACSLECFEKVAWKYGSEYAKYKPVRTDLDEEGIEKLINSTVEEAKQQSLEELADYKDEIIEVGIEGVVDMINREIDKNNGSVLS